MAESTEPRNNGTQLKNAVVWRLAWVKLHELRGQGMSNADISAQFGRAKAESQDTNMVWDTAFKPPLRDVLWKRFRLTRAERRVAYLLAEGKSSAAIAQSLSVTIHTARRHTERVLSKFGIHSRAEVGPAILHALLNPFSDSGDEAQLR